jgi:hypothetical protein
MPDLTITDVHGTTHDYVLDVAVPNPIVHTASPPNVPLNVAMSTPTSAGGQYDVRDTQGDKAITHLDWLEGAGQESLDGPDAVYSRFLESNAIDIQKPGRLSLLKASTETAAAATCGPVFSMNGTIWLGQDAGALKYSTDDGATWSSATLSDVTDASIDAFCSDGSRVYFCVSGSATAARRGVWANTVATPGTFAKLGSTKTTEAITHIAYQGGFLFACTAAGAGLIDKTTGVYTQHTPAFLNTTNTPVGLVAAGNAVYWAVSQGGRSYVYELSYNANTSSMNTEQFIELQSQFIATCAVGYLSSVYIGGYFRSIYEGVGRGGVYVCATNQSYMAPLFELGDYPEDTKEPLLLSNDNRVFAMCESGRDLYIQTSRAIYRWDIDHSGYSHVCDFPGSGVSARSLVWNTNSLLSWSGTDLTVAETHPLFHPNGWTVTDDHVAHWTFTSGQALYNAAASQVWECAPPTTGDADPVLANATGCSLQFDIPASSAGDIDITIRDGTREGRMTISPNSIKIYQYGLTTQVITSQYWGVVGYEHSYVWVNASQEPYRRYVPRSTPIYGWITTNTVTDTANYLWSNETPATGETIKNPTLTAGVGVAKQVRVTLKGTALMVSLDDGQTLLLYTHLTKANAAANLIQLTFKTGAALVTMSFNVGVPSIQTGSTTFRPSMTRHDGKLIAPYYTKASGTAVVGWMKTADTYALTGKLTQSGTTFHTGSIKKDFRYISLTHDVLPAGTTAEATWKIDGVEGRGEGVAYGTTETHVPINQQGFHIESATVLTTSDGVSTPVVRGHNVIWNFVKIRKHQYILDCTPGASNGQWGEDPQTAIDFLFSTSDEKAIFDDRSGEPYWGSIESLEYEQARHSLFEGPCGRVTIAVREEA